MIFSFVIILLFVKPESFFPILASQDVESDVSLENEQIEVSEVIDDAETIFTEEELPSIYSYFAPEGYYDFFPNPEEFTPLTYIEAIKEYVLKHEI